MRLMELKNRDIQSVCVTECAGLLLLFVLEDCEEIDAVSSPLSPGSSVMTDDI